MAWLNVVLKDEVEKVLKCDGIKDKVDNLVFDEDNSKIKFICKDKFEIEMFIGEHHIDFTANTLECVKLKHMYEVSKLIGKINEEAKHKEAKGHTCTRVYLTSNWNLSSGSRLHILNNTEDIRIRLEALTGVIMYFINEYKSIENGQKMEV